MDIVTIQVPEGWLQMTREEYEAHLIPNGTGRPRLLDAKEMERATKIPARRWTEMANRKQIPYVIFGERSYRFDLAKVYQHLEVAPEATAAQPMRRSIREAMKSVG